MKNNELHINTQEVLIAWGIFVVTMVFFRALLPYADEPDFFFRIRDILNNSNESIFHYMLYYLFDDEIRSLSIQECNIKGSVQSLLFKIDDFYCKEPITLIIKRMVFSVFIVTPFFLFCYLGRYEWEIVSRTKVLCCSLIVPSVIYYSSVLAVEQLTLIYSFFLYLFWNVKLIRFILPIIIFPVESGTSIVLFGFVSVFTIYERWFLGDIIKIRAAEFFCLFIALIAFICGMSLLTVLYYIPGIAEKAELIHRSYTEGSFAFAVDKYPIILRPVITFMTAFFMLPSGIKVFPLYFVAGTPFLYVIYLRVFKYHQLSDYKIKAYLRILLVMSFVCSFVFVLPGFSNAKYYVFLMPFIIESLFAFICVKNYFTSIFICNCVLVFSLLVINL